MLKMRTKNSPKKKNAKRNRMRTKTMRKKRTMASC